VPERYWNIGIRIEDDALVTDSGCELMSRDAPVTVADIEAMMREPLGGPSAGPQAGPHPLGESANVPIRRGPP